MIAALATCVFVIYLYHTLNEASSSPAMPQQGAADYAASCKSVERLKAIEERLRTLVNDDAPERAGS